VSQNILDEYLVKLGFTTDTVGYAKFAGTIRNAAGLVDNEYFGMIAQVAKFEATALGAFAAVGAGLVGLVNKTADADQEYRLLAMRMYTNMNTARELKIALDALGQPLENVIWDPELAKRFHQLVQDQREMTKELGPDFENQMMKIRDVRFEFTRFGVELKYLSMLFVQDLAKAFGTSMDDILVKMRNFNEMMIHKLPAIANFLVNTFKPAIVDIKDVMGELWEFTKEVVVVFTNLVGILSNDKSLMSATANWQNFAKALERTVDFLAHVALGILRVGTNIAKMFEAVEQVIAGNYGAAKNALQSMKPVGNLGTDALLQQSGANAQGQGNPLQNATAGLSTPDNIRAAIIEQATRLGVDPRLALAVAQQESGYRQFDKSGNVLMPNDPNSHAMGIFQLQPGTAKSLGVNAADPGENILGGIMLLRSLLYNNMGNQDKALQRYYGSKDASKNAEYSRQVQGIEAGIKIDHLEINVGSGDPGKIQGAVTKGLSDAQQQRIQRNMSEFGVPQWSY
jgi:soluble lytic murein transglycosylase-like protein